MVMTTMMMAVVVSTVTNVPEAKAYRLIQKSDDGDGHDDHDDGDGGESPLVTIMVMTVLI